MCKDYNFWKKKYAFLWDESTPREERVKTIIEKETGCKLEYHGTGAGTTDFINGKSEQKGSPDLHVVGTDIYIEVTGPLSDNVKKGSPLWFRPDKLNHAFKYRFDENTFFINNFKKEGIWYIIHFDDDTIAYAKQSTKNKTDYKKIEPIVRGTKEKYIEVKPNTVYVSDDLQTIVDYINSYKKAQQNETAQSKIKTLRSVMNLTQKEFAKKYEIPLATVQDWEHGRRIPPTYIPTLCQKIYELEKKVSELENFKK